MTEAEWLAPSDTAITICRKLDFILGKASERKFNLFRFACCRQIWQFLLHDVYRQAVESAEKVVEGEMTRAELESVLLMADNQICTVEASRPGSPRRVLEMKAAIAATHAAKSDYEWWSFPNTASYACGTVQQTTSAACWAVATESCWRTETPEPSSDWAEVHEKTRQAQARSQNSILFDVFGNPFRPVILDTACLTAKVVSLAQSIYNDRDFACLPVLADALGQSDCTNADLLRHLRGPGPHVRGCWALDLVLGKQ